MGNKLNKKRYRQVLLLLGILLLGIVTSFSTAIPIKAQKKAGGSFSIDSSYRTWESADLETAQKEVEAFLEKQKGVNPDRVYKDNAQWTEGSLMAIEKAYKSSLEAIDGVSSDLARMLLIETVRKLEERTVFDAMDPSILSLSNYPNDAGEYELEYGIPSVPEDQRSLKYNIMFVLDWSGSMNNSIGTSPNARLRAKKDVEALSKYVIENYEGSKVSLLGYNSERNNIGGFNRQINTGFFGKESNYMGIISSAYQAEPQYNNDDVPAFIADATNLMNTTYDTDSIPVIVTMSDFQLNDSQPKPTTTVQRYGMSLRSYWNLFRQKPAALADPQKRPIYLAVRYDHSQNALAGASGTTANKWQTDNIVGRDRWAYMTINKDNAASSGALIQKLLVDALPVRPSTLYNLENIGTDFEFVPNSLISDKGSTSVTVPRPASINLSNTENDTGRFKVNSLDSAVVNKKMGDLLPSYAESKLNFVNSEFEEFNKVTKGIPQLFSPVTEAAIELYHYKGAGDKADANNYEKKQTIVGNHFNAHNGTVTYSSINAKLSSIKYGETLSKADALGIVKETLGQEEYNKWDFSGNLTESSQKITFDAAKNVYKVYAESNLGQIIVQYKDEAGTPIKDDKSLNGIVGEKYVLDPTNEMVDGYEYLRSEGAPLSGNYEKELKTITLIYRKAGKLVLVSAPPVLNFRTHSYKAQNIRVDDPDYDVDLVVQDSRPVKTKWTLNAKLTDEMSNTAEATVILKDAIRYVYQGKEMILTKEAQPIMVHSSIDNQPVNISKTWKKTKAGDGFKLEVDPGDVKKLGSYQGEILWELAATPDP